MDKNVIVFTALQYMMSGLILCGLLDEETLQPKTKVNNKGAKRIISLINELKPTLPQKDLELLGKQYAAINTRITLLPASEQWSPILTALSILKQFRVTHPASIQKTFDVIKQEDGFGILDKHVINSLIIANKITEIVKGE
jgi:hypothetical protein